MRSDKDVHLGEVFARACEIHCDPAPCDSASGSAKAQLMKMGKQVSGVIDEKLEEYRSVLDVLDAQFAASPDPVPPYVVLRRGMAGRLPVTSALPLSPNAKNDWPSPAASITHTMFSDSVPSGRGFSASLEAVSRSRESPLAGVLPAMSSAHAARRHTFSTPPVKGGTDSSPSSRLLPPGYASAHARPCAAVFARTFADRSTQDLTLLALNRVTQKVSTLFSSGLPSCAIFLLLPSKPYDYWRTLTET